MKTEIIEPKNREEWLSLRAKNMNSSEVAALFGFNPWLTKFELFHRKKDGAPIDDIEPSEAMKWGNRLEAAIALGIAEDNGFEVKPFKQYLQIPELRMGSSFDFQIGEDGILEIKNVHGMKFRDEWLKNEDGTVEAPAHVELQVQHQLAVSNRTYVFIGALISGNQVALIQRERDEKVIARILEETDKFWWDIKNDKPPKPDFNKDAQFINSLYKQADSGLVLDLAKDDELTLAALAYNEASKVEKTAKARKDAAKAEILMRIGEAGKVFGNGFSISAKTVKAASIAYDRGDYRGFRVNWRKEK